MYIHVYTSMYIYLYPAVHLSDAGGVSGLGEKLHDVKLNSNSDNSSNDSGDSKTHLMEEGEVNGHEVGDMTDGNKPQAKLVVSGDSFCVVCIVFLLA